ncbi:hypothetical protein ABK040_000180 [Willaertia magna]
MRKMGRKLGFLKVLGFEGNSVDELLEKFIPLSSDKDKLYEYFNNLEFISQFTKQFMIRPSNNIEIEEEWIKQIKVGDWIVLTSNSEKDILNSNSPPMVTSLCVLNETKCPNTIQLNVETYGNQFINWTNNSELMTYFDILRKRYTDEEEDDENHQKPKRKLCVNFKLGIKCNNPNCDRRHYFFNQKETDQNYRDENNITLITEANNEEKKLNRARRAQIFAKFLVDKYGIECLSKGSGVLDVAGGKGEVSYYLITEYGIKSTVIDPRIASLSEKQLKNLQNRELKYLNNYFVEDEREWSEEVSLMIQSCSIIIGLHPDQATESIVNVALKYNKLFVVVPCCVFPSLFPDRRLLNGQEVNNYSQFIQYLLEKQNHHDSNLQSKNTIIKLDYLPVIGMNKVILREEVTEENL